MKVVGVAAAFLVVAGAIGFLAQGGLMSSADGERPTAFQRGRRRGRVGRRRRQQREPSAGSRETHLRPYQRTTSTHRRRRRSPASNEDAPGFALEGQVGGQQQDLSKIVRDGRIGIVVPDDEFGDAVGDLTFIAEQYGGFVLSSSTNNDRSGTFVLRIPAKRFDRAVGDIRDLATRVRFQEVRGDDVTAEFID